MPLHPSTAGYARIYDPATYGAPFDGVSDDTVGINRAIEAAAAAGGTVALPANRGAWKIQVTTIEVLAGVHLSGVPGATWIEGNDLTAGHATILADEGSGSLFGTKISGLVIEDGYNAVQIPNLSQPGPLGHARMTIEDIISLHPHGTSFATGTGNSYEIRLINCYSSGAWYGGYYIESTDAQIIACTAQNATSRGFVVLGGNNHLISCKAFGGGAGGRAFDIFGGGRHVLSACETQENNGDGFYLQSANNTLSGCLAGGDAGVAYHLAVAGYNHLSGCSQTNAYGVYDHTAALKIAAGGTRGAVVDLVADASTLTAPGHDATGCTVTINGAAA